MSLRNLNIYLRKDGRYEGRYKSKSGTIKYFYSRLEEVVARQMIIYIAHDFENEAQETESSKTDSARLAPFETKIKENHPDKSDTLEEIAKRWIEGKRKEDKESSVGIYANYIRLYILPKFGDKKVEDVKDAEADEYFQSLSKEGRESAQDDTTPSSKALSISTVNESIRIMNCLMKFAAESGYSVNFNSLKRLKKEAKDEQKVLSGPDRKKLEDYIGDNPLKVNIGIFLAMYTGIRIGELCGLKWRDIDLGSKTLTVRHTLQRIKCFGGDGKKTKVVLTAPKSLSSVRTIPLVDAVVEMIKKNYANYSACDPDSYFLTGDKSKFIEPRFMEDKFSELLRGAGVERIRFHGLRHSFSTLCIEAKIDAKSISDMMGHSSPVITLALYSHPSMNHKRENLNRAFEAMRLSQSAAG